MDSLILLPNYAILLFTEEYLESWHALANRMKSKLICFSSGLRASEQNRQCLRDDRRTKRTFDQANSPHSSEFGELAEWSKALHC